MAFLIFQSCGQQLKRVHPFVPKKSGMHQSMQRGSIARTVSTCPMSGFPGELIQNAAHGLLRRLVIAADEQIGVPPLNVGFTMRAWPMELKQEKTHDPFIILLSQNNWIRGFSKRLADTVVKSFWNRCVEGRTRSIC
jgi:hypothetical protein